MAASLQFRMGIPARSQESKAYEPCGLSLPAMAMLGAGAVLPGQRRAP